VPYKKYGTQAYKKINKLEKLSHIFSYFDVKKISLCINLFIMNFFRTNGDAKTDFVFYVHT
jgi:hypothetical protein